MHFSTGSNNGNDVHTLKRKEIQMFKVAPGVQQLIVGFLCKNTNVPVLWCNWRYLDRTYAGTGRTWKLCTPQPRFQTGNFLLWGDTAPCSDFCATFECHLSRLSILMVSHRFLLIYQCRYFSLVHSSTYIWETHRKLPDCERKMWPDCIQ